MERDPQTSQAAADEAAAARREGAPADGASSGGERVPPVAPTEGDGSGPEVRAAAAGVDQARAETADEAEPEKAPDPDYRDQYLRAMAELDNVRKRARRDVSQAEARGIAKLARELLPALDNFSRALDAAEAQPENRDHHLTDGIRLVQTELLSALARVGIEPDSPKGEPFDPHCHEAIAQTPVEGAASGTIVEVYSQGYRYRDDVLRPAKVVVAA
jgi:molecular chaperone GrpE